MIEFKAKRVDRRNNTPVISDAEIDEYAQFVLADYKPQLLKEPGKIKWEHFLESYCGVTLCFYDIYNEDKNRPILGATAFNDEEMKVFDRERMCISRKLLERITVVIDNSVMESDNEGFARFTGLHEGGHVLIHPSVYMRDENQLSLFDDEPVQQVVCCRKENIESFGRPTRGFKTPEEWREHHADYFAAALAMPKATFIPFVKNVFAQYGLPDRIVIGHNHAWDDFARHTLTEFIRDAFGVSKKAAYIKLRKCKFVIDSETYQSEQQQFKFAFTRQEVCPF